MSALVARTASFGRKKKSTTAAAAVPVPAAASADAPPPPGAPGRAARVANALEARSMLLPGVTAAGLPTQNDDMWDGLQEGTEAEFEEATNAYVEVCNNAQVWGAAPGSHPHPLIGRARRRASPSVHVHTRAHTRTRARASLPRPTPALGTCHAQPSPGCPVRGHASPGPHPNACGSFGPHPGSQCDKQFMHTWQKHSTVSLPADWPALRLPTHLAPPPPNPPPSPHTNPPLAIGSRPSPRL
jgi:hypothetical protein